MKKKYKKKSLFTSYQLDSMEVDHL